MLLSEFVHAYETMFDLRVADYELCPSTRAETMRRRPILFGLGTSRGGVLNYALLPVCILYCVGTTLCRMIDLLVSLSAGLELSFV